MNDDFFLSLNDLKIIYRKNRSRIKSAALFTFLLVFIWVMSSPNSYQVSATFKLGNRGASEQWGNFKEFVKVLSGGISSCPTTSIMLSKRVMNKVIEQLGLQVVEEPPLSNPWKRITSLFTFDSLPSKNPVISFKDVSYSGERKLKFYLKILSQNDFEILNDRFQGIGQGALGKSCIFKEGEDSMILTLAEIPLPFENPSSLYPFLVLPKETVYKTYRKKISIGPLREDKQVLSIKFVDSSRYRAATFVNTLMQKYTEFLMEENERAIESQLKYLHRRQHELNQELEDTITQYVGMFSENLHKQGFMGIKEELKFVMEPLQNYRNRLNEIEVRLNSLEKRIQSTTLTTSSEPSSLRLGRLLSSIVQLPGSSSIHMNSPSSLYLSPLLPHSWYREGLKSSLDYVNALETDFRGMSLKTAEELFQKYCTHLETLHSQMKQILFLRRYLEASNFEIGTISNILNDSVTGQLISRTTDIEAQLCDPVNRSEKERDRLKQTLAIYKRFIASHIDQTVGLNIIQLDLIKQKMGSLYQIIRNLLIKEKEVLEKKIADIKTSLEELPERWGLDKKLNSKGELIKCIMEGISGIAESKNLSQNLYQVESTPLDIADIPLKPEGRNVWLKSTIAAFLSALVIYMGHLAHALIRGLPVSLSGLRHRGAAVAGVLTHSNIIVPFEKLDSSYLNTLRGITAFLKKGKSLRQGSVIAVLGEQIASHRFHLARLLNLYGDKVSFIDCHFDRLTLPEDQPGLAQYLQSYEMDGIPFRSGSFYDWLPAGITSEHAGELLATRRFGDLLDECRHRYAFTFLICQGSLTSPDAVRLLDYADQGVLSIENSAYLTLQPFLRCSNRLIWAESLSV